MQKDRWTLGTAYTEPPLPWLQNVLDPLVSLPLQHWSSSIGEWRGADLSGQPGTRDLGIGLLLQGQNSFCGIGAIVFILQNK